MSQALIEICRQLRLAHVVEAVHNTSDAHVAEMMEQMLLAELEGRRRAKLGKLVGTAGFPHLKTFEGYVFDHITFPHGSTQEMVTDLGWLERRENLLLMGAEQNAYDHNTRCGGL